MHYHAEVWLPSLENFEDQLEEIMHRCSEHNDDAKLKIHDWWQIGGRWKGAHVPDYDPEVDPTNFEKGTTRVAWPTQWKPHARDILAVSALPKGLTANTLIVGDKILYDDQWDQDVLAALKSLGVTDGYLVTIDMHN